MVKLLDSVVILSKNHIGNITKKILSVHAISVAKGRYLFKKANTCSLILCRNDSSVSSVVEISR